MKARCALPSPETEYKNLYIGASLRCRLPWERWTTSDGAPFAGLEHGRDRRLEPRPCGGKTTNAAGGCHGAELVRAGVESRCRGFR